ncbi:transposase, partial (plasmid) [Enterobacter asburiae]
MCIHLNLMIFTKIIRGFIRAWYESATPSSRGRPQRYSDLAITTVLVIKRVFRLTLRAAQGF